MKVIGKNYRKVDAMAKCVGATKFADDVILPRMLFAKILRSTQAHARIKRIDTSRAEKHPGVIAVLTGASLPIKFGILPVSEDEHTLAIEVVRYVGDPVAAVAAIDEDTAEEAIELIDVEYEPLPAMLSIQDALDHPETQIHADEASIGNIQKQIALEFGDMAGGFDAADVVREDLYFYQGNTHLPMEQHAAVAVFDADQKLTLWSSTQTPHYVHRALAKVLQIPASCVRVIATPNGGGFGGKSDPFSHEIVASKLAMMTGRPVKICLTREEVFYCHRGRHPVLMRVKMGVKKDGTITALHFQTMLDGGAHGSYGVASTYYTGALQTVTYKVPNYKFDGLRVFTNKPPCGPKRGHGTPQPRYALEIEMDKIAEQLTMDPVDLRLKQLVEPHSLTANYLKVGSIGLRECIEKVAAAADWKNRYRKMPFGKGIGFAVGSYLSGAGLPIYWNPMPHSGVQLKLDRSGLCTIFCGSIDIGQGSDSILAYIVAEVLGLDPIVDIKVITADTDLTPVDLGSYSSRVTLMTGNAAIQAAERAKELIAKAVAERLKITVDRIGFADRRVFDVENPQNGLTFQDAVVAAEAKFGTIGTVGSYVPPVSHGKYKGAGVGPSPAYSYSACVAEVDIDPSTGILRVPKIWIAHDIGRAINTILSIGQVEGGVYMGLGEVLMEEQEFRRDVHRQPSLLDYKSPTTIEMCDVETILVEDPDPNGPFGAKEVGQGPLLPVIPAVANAVFAAIGVRIDEIPIHPEKILKALKRQDKRFGPTYFPKVTWPEPLRVKTPWQGGDGKAEQTEVSVHRGLKT
jgi:4-hydroxybenzoyl-CoA reductase alpha subunit